MSQITLTRPQRDAVYQQLATRLSGVGDIYLMLEIGDYKAVQRLRRDCEDAMRLLDDLGWAPDVPGEEFEVTMPFERLVPAISRLHEEATESLDGYVQRPRGDDDDAQRDLVACQAYANVLATLSEHEGDGAQIRKRT